LAEVTPEFVFIDGFVGHDFYQLQLKDTLARFRVVATRAGGSAMTESRQLSPKKVPTNSMGHPFTTSIKEKKS
jgi:hypothetical protein